MISIAETPSVTLAIRPCCLYPHSRIPCGQGVAKLGVAHITSVTMIYRVIFPDVVLPYILARTDSPQGLFRDARKLASFSPTLSISNGPRCQRAFMKNRASSSDTKSSRNSRQSSLRETPPSYMDRCITGAWKGVDSDDLDIALPVLQNFLTCRWSRVSRMPSYRARHFFGAIYRKQSRDANPYRFLHLVFACLLVWT